MDIYVLVFELLTQAHKLDLVRAHEVADTIATVVEDAQVRDPEGTALDLLTIASHESSLRKSVETCEKTGDKGRSIGLWQMQRHTWQGHSRDEICSDPILSASIALRFWRKTRSFRMYAGCQPDLECKPADEMKAIRARYGRWVSR